MMTNSAVVSRPLSNSSIPAVPAGVVQTTLPNGLNIIIKEDSSAPVVSAQAWCLAGSIHEGTWIGAGLSHVLEHMLFKGTTTRGAGRIDQEVQDVGGYMNAYTSFDRTVYWINAPSSGTHTVIDILCDIMQNATLPEDELLKEMDVIRREMDMNQDDPARRSSRRLFETVYTQSPYRYTIIGYPDVFNELKREDIVAYYRESYAPNNVFFVVVGDVSSDQIRDQIAKAYTKTKSRPLPPRVLPEEPTQMAPREVLEEAPIELGHMHFSWHIPELRHPDIPALDVLSTLLGGGRSSRLFQQVREKQGVVHTIDAWTYSPGSPGLIGISAMVDGQQFNSAKQTILQEVNRARTSGVTQAELDKAVKQLTSNLLSARKTMQGQAQDLGSSWAATNDLNFSERYLETVKSLCPEDITRVAAQYLTTENQTLYSLLPNGHIPSTVESIASTPQNSIQKLELTNGLRLLTKEDHRLPFVEIRAVFQGGVTVESPTDNGITQLMARLLVKGTKTRSSAQLMEIIENAGGALDSYGGNNSFGINLEILSADLPLALDVLADVIQNPTFPEGELEREREVQLAGIRAQNDHMLQSAFRLMKRTMFGQDGYGQDAIGREDSVSHLSREQIQAFHDRFATPNNCVLAIYGDIDPASLQKTLETRFSRWTPGSPFSLNRIPNFKTQPQHAHETRDKAQAVLVMAFPGTTFSSDDRFPLEILQETCSDLGSRLFVRIREKLGLAYFVGAQHFPGLLPGYFAFYVGTAPDKVELVERELLAEVESIRAEGITESELKRSKAKIIGHKKISRQDLGNLASSTALDELCGLGYDNTEREEAKIEAVTLSQVKAAAQKYLRTDQMVIAVVRPEG